MRFVGNLFTSLVLISTQVSAQDHTHDTAPVKSVHLPEKPSNYVHNYLKALSCAKVSDFKNPQMAVDDLHWDLASRLSEGDFTYEQFRQELISYYRGAMRDAPLFFGSEKSHLWLPEDPETLFHELDKLGSLMQAQRTQQSSEDAYWLKKNEVALNQSSKNIEAWVRRNKFNHYSIKNQNDCPPYVQTLFNNGGTFRNKIFSQKNADHFHTSRDFKTRHLNVDGSAREKFTPALHRPLTAEQTAQNIVDSIWCPHFTEQVWEMFYRLQNSEFQGPELAAELQKAIKHRAALGDRNGETSLEDLLQNDKNFSHNWTDLLNRINVLMKRPAIDVPADKVSVSSSLPYFEGAERANRLNGEFEYLRSSVQRLEQSLSPHLWKKIDTRKGKDLLKQQEGARPLMSTQSRKECQMPPSQLGSDFLRYSLQKNRHSASQKSKALRDEHQVKLNELLALEKSKTKEFLDRIALLPKQEDTERSVLNKELTDLKLQHQGAEEALPKIIAADLKSFQADLEQSFADEEEALMHTLQVKYENEIEKNGEWNFKGACFNHKNEAITNNKILSEIYGRFSDELVNNLMKIRKNPASKVDASSQTIARFQKAMYLGCAESDFHMITLAPHGRETEGQYSREFSLEKIDEMLS